MKAKVVCWVAREWRGPDGRVKRQKKTDRAISGVKPDDRWCVQWLEPDRHRRLETIALRGRDGLAAALQRKAELEASLGDGTYQRESSEPTTMPGPMAWADFRKLFEARYQGKKVAVVRDSTRASYLQSLDLFAERCSPKLLVDVNRAMIDDFRAMLADESSPDNTKRHLRAIRCALNAAADWELLDRVPKFPELSSGANETRPIPDADMEKLYAACSVARYPYGAQQPYTAAQWWQGVLVVGGFTGLRRDEWRFLRWDDVDLDKGTIVISRERAKSRKAAHVPLLPVVVDHLRRIWDHGPFVFPFVRTWACTDRDLGLSTLYQEWRAILKAAGLEGKYTFHHLRDTALSNLARYMSPTQLHAFSRHAAFSTTERHYLDRDTVLNGALDRVAVPAFFSNR